jgi:hypothetical protein
MKIKQWIQNKKEQHKGFTLLFAVLVSTLVVAIGATVVSIALRQTILSGTSRESQYAFYAANTVLECVFYWDVIGLPTATGKVFPSSAEIALTAGEMNDVKCSNGNIVTGAGFEGGTSFADSGWIRNPATPNVTNVKIEIFDTTGQYDHRYCAEASISKIVMADGTTVTTIQAKGYNTCDLDSPRAVERGLVQSYES